MSTRPWMPLYIADYRADTAHLSAAQHGAYLLLIMHYWTTGGLPMDDAPLARIAGMTPAEWKKNRPTIAAFFTADWKHKRIDAELAKATDISIKRRASAEQRHSKSNANADANAQQLDTHAGATSQPQTQSQTSSLRSEVAGARASLLARFDEFWQAYPHKVGKQAAFKTFERIAKSGHVTFEKLMIGLVAYSRKTDDRPWCNPATWLNEGRWDDQPAPEVSRNGRHDESKSILAAADRLIEQHGGMEAARAYVPGSSGPRPLALDFGPSPPDIRRLPSR
jgi:uncharacterized protein YdaU (DUF1376 family)